MSTTKPNPTPAAAGPTGAATREPQGMRGLMGYVTEAIVSLGIAFVFFGMFLALLNVVFPTGMQLRELVVPRSRESETTTGAPPGLGVLARLTVLRSDVRSKPAGAIAWSSAGSRLALHDRDAIQTMSSGRGLVVFEDGDQVRLERNSLVILSAGSAESEGMPATGPAVEVVNGELWGRVTLGRSERMKVKLPGGELQLAAGNASSTQFRVSVAPDKAAAVTVFEGQASITANGKTVELAPRQGTRLTVSGDLTEARTVLPAPQASAPDDGTELRYSDFAPQILFRWTPVPGADHYRIVVARDRGLEDVVIDQTVDRTDFLCGALKRGDYVWRVSSLREDVEGPCSDWRSVRTTVIGGPPKLAVDEIPKVLEEGTCRVTGRTLPGSRIMILGESVPVAADGRFEHTLTLEPGANVVTIEAIDAQGNASYWTRVVHVKS